VEKKTKASIFRQILMGFKLGWKAMEDSIISNAEKAVMRKLKFFEIVGFVLGVAMSVLTLKFIILFFKWVTK
jgi:hypothetical protein